MRIRAIKPNYEITYLQVKKVTKADSVNGIISVIRLCRPERIKKENLKIDDYLYNQKWVKDMIEQGNMKGVIVDENGNVIYESEFYYTKR